MAVGGVLRIIENGHLAACMTNSWAAKASKSNIFSGK
jgi:hypothetical protein